MIALIGWNVAVQIYAEDVYAYLISSAIGLAFFLVVLLEMQRAPTAR